ncbi:hypothetical protein QQP08_006444 [Theobroma cacao]|nr:hypothetical protein QQP08_006444 [Theobroma cacao]
MDGQGQVRAMNAVACLLLFLSILVISKTDAQSLRGLRFSSSHGVTEWGSSIQTMKRSGPSPSGPGHKSSESPSQGSTQGSGPRREEGFLHFSRVHH